MTQWSDKMLLGIDTFSLRSQGWNAFQMLDYAAGLALQNVHFSERANLESHDDDYLRELRRYADERGIQIEVGMRSINTYAETFDASLGSGEQQLADMLVAAKKLGSPVVRCFVGMQNDRLGAVPFAQIVDETIRTLKAAAPAAEQAGIAIAVENHGGVDLLARELRAIVEEVGSDFVGVCLDTGNPLYGGEDAVLATEILAPYVKTAHVRDTRVWAIEHGAAVQWAPAGQGDIDLRRIVEILNATTPDIALDLEIISGGGWKEINFRNPDDEFWSYYPGMLASDFIRFENLLDGGSTGPLDQYVPDGPFAELSDEERERYLAQQRHQFEISVAYCHDHLGLA
ncbi:MAG TPA: sugar phosphate isomerase/epimerase [Thermomicrobiales bacterium]|nr:sugar phosphate isomerase/epimerase [Thermomicrobiales bacterium]